jgi:glycosyltransferase involved in cell wall biosynthesis
MLLSIVMLTIPERKKRFEVLKKKVQKQIDFIRKYHLHECEIVEVNSKKLTDGGKSIGAKRQEGLELSKGKYVCWLDDDDDIAPNYIQELTRLAVMGADVCTFSSFCMLNDYFMIAEMKLEHEIDEDARQGIIKRRPYQVCAFKKELLNNAKFPDTNWEEDVEFINAALPNCKSSAHSEAILHVYRRVEKSYA